MQKTFTYDGSFDGFLSVVFSIYEERIESPIIKKESEFHNQLFGAKELVITDSEKAQRVWNGLIKTIGSRGCTNLYYAFLSEIETVKNTILNVMRYALKTKKNIITDYSDPDVLQISKIVKKVGREKHRMEAFVRFQQTKDGIYFANIEPDFNVLPLIKSHFTKRYADQKWIIYDLKRKYGLFYNLETTEIITLDFTSPINKEMFTDNEKQYESLWKDYFKSTNIEERVNMVLHVKHVPKRYWKYLSEKK